MPEDAEQPSLPAFITAPVRIPTEEPPAQPVETGAEDGSEGAGFHLRPRRRRRRPAGEGEAGPSEAPVSGDLPFGD